MLEGTHIIISYLNKTSYIIHVVSYLQEKEDQNVINTAETAKKNKINELGNSSRHKKAANKNEKSCH